MTAKTERRTLSIWPSEQRAELAALGPWDSPRPRDVQVEWGVRGTTPERPWAVTAAKAGQP